MLRLICLPLVLLALAPFNLLAAEHHVLSEANYDSLAPQGKEVDAIYGDHLLQNDQVVLVIAAPNKDRNANLTVKNVGGSIIDFTEQRQQNDQLSCFYPGGGSFRFTEAEVVEPTVKNGVAIKVIGQLQSPAAIQPDDAVQLEVIYELRDNEPFVRVTSTWTNPSDKAKKVSLVDGLRVDGPFDFGTDSSTGLSWCHEIYWKQAYGLQPESDQRTASEALNVGRRRPRQIGYPLADESRYEVELAPGDSTTLARRFFPAADSIAARAIASEGRGDSLVEGLLWVYDVDGPVAGAEVRLVKLDGEAGEDQEKTVGIGVTDQQGALKGRVQKGRYRIEVSAQGHPKQRLMAEIYRSGIEGSIQLDQAGFVNFTITDGEQPVAAKIDFQGLDGTPTPNFGPDSAVHGVLNLHYTHNGEARVKLLPGHYSYLVSHGPEHDAVRGEVNVVAGKEAELSITLPRTVDTTGWLSSELHSHSSPSGDNTASQRGRVLNLLAEHLEFCPCTEHQRVDVYDEHLEHFNAQEAMLTCPGMELTGGPLPLNHQNAFPLVHKPHQQDGGGPKVDRSPVDQIKRLAGWDNNAEKVVQTNHPNTAQMLGDRDLNGKPDEGFEAMFGYMDVVEIHPPELLFTPLGGKDNGVGQGGWDNRGNAIQNWMQMHNLGYRVTGVVNTDAHYNHHGSGWLRNWVRSSTDNPAEASVSELVHEFEAGHVIMSNGPFLEAVLLRDEGIALPGDLVTAPTKKVTVRVTVRCPNWIDVNRVQLFLNGRPVEKYNYTTRSHGDWFQTGPERFSQEIEVELTEDTSLIVAACGEGATLGAVYGQDRGNVMPVAVANPFFIDIDGDQNGDSILFEPNGDDLGVPLPHLDETKPSHGHDHPNHRHSHGHSHPHSH